MAEQTINRIKMPEGTVYGLINLAGNNSSAAPDKIHSADEILHTKISTLGNEIDILPLMNRTRANRLAFLPSDQIIIEKTTDGGKTWNSSGLTDLAKIKLFSTEGVLSVPSNGGIRITITGNKYNVATSSETEKYNYWNSSYKEDVERDFIFSGLGFYLIAYDFNFNIECANISQSHTWETLYSGANLNAEHDFLYVNFDPIDSISEYNFRITFFNNGSTLKIYSIQGYGPICITNANNMMYLDTLYSWDENQNAIFPKSVIADNIPNFTVNGRCLEIT